MFNEIVNVVFSPLGLLGLILLVIIFLCLATYGLVRWILKYKRQNKPIKFGR